MLNRFISIHDEPQEVADAEGLDLTKSHTNRFRIQHSKLIMKQNEIDVVFKKLQKRGMTLYDSHFLSKNLKESINCQKNSPICRLYDCALGDDHIKLHSTHFTNYAFHAGLIKLHRMRLRGFKQRKSCIPTSSLRV